MVSRLRMLGLGLGLLSTVLGCATTPPPPVAPLRATLPPAAPSAVAPPAPPSPAVLHTAQRLTALTLVPGTLNIRLLQPFDGLLPWYLTEADLGGNVWRDHLPSLLEVPP